MTTPALSRREKQILDVIYRLGRATAAEVHAQIEDAPTYTTVRGLLRVLESKGHIRHEEDGARYIYLPNVKKGQAGRSELAHVVQTFFDGSPSRAMAAILGSERTLDEQELDRLSELIERARRKERR